MINMTLPFTATKVQAASYLLGVCLFSISFLVFLNSAVSFVITDRIGQKTRVGDAVGTLGFADELVALLACPVWGMLSDRVGVRAVAVTGYTIVGISLVVFVQAKNVYPQLLLGRLLFSLGGAATSTMVTAILPAMTLKLTASLLPITIPRHNTEESRGSAEDPSNPPSITSELTVTPARFHSRTPSAHSTPNITNAAPSASKLAGIVGMLTGVGALVALGFFLPLPTRFQQGGVSRSEAVAYSFYVVGTIAILVAAGVFFGLRNLPGEEEKGWNRLMNSARPSKAFEVTGRRNPTKSQVLPSYAQLLLTSMKLGFTDVSIGLGYIGGFVARASSVAISLFIPLFVNAFFISSGRCPADTPEDPHDPASRANCKRAYIVAAILAGVSQLIALICAPVFGYLSAEYSRFNVPMLLASVAGIAGYTLFARIQDPDPRGEDGKYNVGPFFIVALLGISQIGAIVCSLGQLARGIEMEDTSEPGFFQYANGNGNQNGDGVHPYNPNANGELEHEEEEVSPLLPSHLRHITGAQGSSRAKLKGSIAGMYSLAGGAGILLLTKVGGLMFDRVDYGAPFFMMAAFNAVLFAVTLTCGIWETWRGEKSGRYEFIEEEEAEERGNG